MVPVLLSLWQMEPAVCRFKISLRHTDSITNRENLSDHSPSFAIVIHRPLARLLSASHSVRARRASMTQESCKSVIKARCETLASERKKWSNISELIWHVFLGFVVFSKNVSPVDINLFTNFLYCHSKMSANEWVMPRLPPNQRYKTDCLFSATNSPPKTRFLKASVFHWETNGQRDKEKKVISMKAFLSFQSKLHFWINP